MCTGQLLALFSFRPWVGWKFITELDPSMGEQLNFNVELVASVLGCPKSLYTGGMDILEYLKTVGTSPTSLGPAA